MAALPRYVLGSLYSRNFTTRQINVKDNFLTFSLASTQKVKKTSTRYGGLSALPCHCHFEDIFRQLLFSLIARLNHKALIAVFVIRVFLFHNIIKPNILT